VAKCISNFKKQSCTRYSKGANFGLKCARMCLAAGLRPDPLGELERSPRLPTAIGGGVPTSKGEGHRRKLLLGSGAQAPHFYDHGARLYDEPPPTFVT